MKLFKYKYVPWQNVHMEKYAYNLIYKRESAEYRVKRF